MANLMEQKLNSSDFSGHNIQALPDKPTITAGQLKARFDYAAEQVVAPKHNALIDILTDATEGVSGAEQIASAPISGVAGDTVHEQMADLKYQFDNVLLDPRIFPDGSVTTARLMDEAVTIEKIDPDVLAWNNISGKPASFAPVAHTHAAGDLPSASTTAVGVVQLDSLLNSTSETRAATPLAVKTVNDKAVSLATWRDTMYPAVQGAANDFTITIADVISYSQIPGNFRFYVDAASDTPRVRINALPWCNVMQGAQIQKPVKLSQWGRVCGSFEGTGFFVNGAGGGDKTLITELIDFNRIWSMPKNVLNNYVEVLLFGGGGGVGGNGGGGGGGQYGWGSFQIAAGTQISITVGAGGALGIAGGVTSFGGYLAASGGSPGDPGSMSGGSGGSGGGGRNVSNVIAVNGGNAQYGGGGGGAGAYTDNGGSIKNGGAGGAGGTYGGGGGGGGGIGGYGSGSEVSGAGGAKGTYGGAGSQGGKPAYPTAGANGTNTVGTNNAFGFEGTGVGGAANPDFYGGGSGGGGYGGKGGSGGGYYDAGNGRISGGGGGGGGGYGVDGGKGNATNYTHGGTGHGGGGGGWGGRGGDATVNGPGGGGGYSSYGYDPASGHGAGFGSGGCASYPNGVQGIILLRYWMEAIS